MSTVPVTLIVPTWNGGAAFRRALAAIAALAPGPERFLVVDSSSTDGSARLARDAGAEVTVIERAQFDHGGTRMAAVRQATSPLVAFLSQDAIPAQDYLAHLVAALADDRTAGATARILPYDDSSPLARRTVLASPCARSEPRVIEVDPAVFATLSGRARRELCLFDDVASLARRDVLLRHPFPRTMMGEDAAFAAAVLAAGMRLRFVPRAVVRHAHEYGPVTAFRRYRDDARWLRGAFDEAVRRTPADVLRGLAYEVREDLRALRDEAPAARLGALLRSPFLRAGQVLGQWWGTITGAAR